MSKPLQSRPRRSSFAHQDPSLRAQNLLYKKTAPVRGSFEQNRCGLHARELVSMDKSEAERRRDSIAHYKAKRNPQGSKPRQRDSEMVRNAVPKMILKPPLSVGFPVDAARHRHDLAKERRKAKQGQATSESEQSLRKELYRAARLGKAKTQSRKRQR